jgi:glycine/sarcosine N-methyltransferase
MADSTLEFYNLLTDEYHLIFDDWKRSVERQAGIIDQFIQRHYHTPPDTLSVLDCSCGIGTQAIGLAKLGYRMTASDLSPNAVQRAKKEAERLGAKLIFKVADFCQLENQIAGCFDVVISFDNSLPHLLDDQDLKLAIKNIWNKLNLNGLFIASIRDYDRILLEKPSVTTPYFYNNQQGKRVTFQVWEWENERPVYTLNHFITKEDQGSWTTKHRSSKYRAILRGEMNSFLEAEGFSDIHWHMPETTGFYQPIVMAVKT